MAAYEPTIDVIVIGCGASGIAALRRLHDAGLKVIGLEAADRIGGRVHSVQHGGGFIDLGGEWCHGERDNVVFDMIKTLDLVADSEPNHIYYLLSNGKLVPNEKGGAILQILDEEIDKADKNNSKSISEFIDNVAKTNPSLQKDSELVQCIVEWYKRGHHLGGEIDPKASKSLKGLKEWWVSAADPLRSWKGKGYRIILDYLLNKYPDAAKELSIPIHLNKEVENINWSTNKPDVQCGTRFVDIKCKDGSSFAAKSVIVTVSFGVLQERCNQLFTPSLPVKKINSIMNLQRCVLDKIYIEFSHSWWPKSPSTFTMLWQEEDKAKFTSEERWLTEIYALNTVDYHPNLLLASICSEGAIEMEKTSEENIKVGVEKLLKVFFSKEFEPNPVKSILRSQWALNPLIRGSYFYRSVNTEENDASDTPLSEPLYNDDRFPVVCFAGDNTSHNKPNGVHGAVAAGFREADRLIASFKDLQ